MFFKRKVNLTTLAENLSEQVSAKTLGTIHQIMVDAGQEDSGDMFHAHFFGQLMAWSVTANSAKDPTVRQICFAIADQLPHRYADSEFASMIEGFTEPNIRHDAEKFMREVVASAKEKNSDLGSSLGFWVARQLNADPMTTMTMPLEYIQCIAANARLANKMARKFNIVHDIKY